MEYDLTKLTPDIRRTDEMREVMHDKNFARTLPNENLYFMYRGLEANGELRCDITVISAKMLGDEFNKTKGHYHVGAYPEVYTVLEGTAIYLLQKRNDAGEIEDVFAIETKKGETAIMPPFYGHVTINPSETEDLKMANWVSDKCKSDYSPFVQKQGACYYYTKSGWVKNENYTIIPELRFEQPLKSLPEDLDFLKNG